MNTDLQTNHDAVEMRKKVFALEAELKNLPQLHIDIQHHFAPGLYMREGFLPKGTLLTGAVHKTEHFIIVSRGSVLVLTEDGPKKLDASSVIHSNPGAKRAIHALEDSVLINVHHNPTNERDLGKIWDIFVANSEEEFQDFIGREHRMLEGSK